MTSLIVRTGGLGDCIVTLPVAFALREYEPDTAIDVLGNAFMIDIAGLSGIFGRRLSIEDSAYFSLFTDSTDDSLAAFFSCYDRVFFFSSGNYSLIETNVRALGVRYCRVLDPRPPVGWNRHISKHLLRIIDDFYTAAHLPVIPSVKTATSRLNRTLVIHPGSGSVAKNWPLERFVAIAGQYNGPVVFLLGPAEVERGCCELLDDANVDYIETTTLEECVAVFGGASLFLGNDSGTSHLAAICGVPAIVLFGPTDPVVWKPFGDHVTVIRSKSGSMDGIGYEEVLTAVKGILP